MSRDDEPDAPPASPPHRVGLPVNLHRWETMTFLHWPFEPEVVQRLLPPALRVLTHGGAAWVGVTPFRIRVRVPGVPYLPVVSTFPEINVRTYVTDDDGTEGLWFLRMEVPRLWFVVTLRAAGLPYFWPRMALQRRDAGVTYTSRPRPPVVREASTRVVVRPGAATSPAGGDARDRFLTARWGAYHRRGPWLLYTPAEHEPWPLHAATLEHCDVTQVLRDAGLPSPRQQPVVHYSPGVRVKIGVPRAVHRRGGAGTSQSPSLPPEGRGTSL